MNKRLCQIKSDNVLLDYSSSTPILKGISKEEIMKDGMIFNATA